MVIAVYREPMAFDGQSLVIAPPKLREMPDGLSLAQMADRLSYLPENFHELGTICINGYETPKALWGAIKPKPAVNGVPIEVTFHVAAAGGGEDGKNPFAFLAAIALTVATGFVAGGGLEGALGASFAQGTVGSYIAAAGVSYVGQLLITSLSPTPTTPDAPDTTRVTQSSASGNVLRPGAPIPRVVGTRKIYPTLICEPFTYFDGQDTVVEAVYALAGPHKIEDIRINDAPISDLGDVQYEIREGWRGDDPLTLVTRYSKVTGGGNEIGKHAIKEGSNTELDVGVDGVKFALPQPQTVVTRRAPDEHHLQLVFPAGLNKNAGSDKYRVPFRLAMRRVGESDWRNLPELHYQNAASRGIPLTIKLIWTDGDELDQAAAGSTGWVEARVFSPGQNVDPIGDSYVADTYFYSGSGEVYLSSDTIGSSGVRHVVMGQHDAIFYLDPAEFEPGQWEIKIHRGYAFKADEFDSALYRYPNLFVAEKRDFFGYENEAAPKINQSVDLISDIVQLTGSVSVFNRNPAPSDECAYLAIRARNRKIDKLSVVASGYVPDWNGTSWSDWKTTSNPAPHLRDIYAGELSKKPIATEIIRDDELLAWRTDCEAKGYKVNAYFEGKSSLEAANIVASCGYAKPRRSDEYGVVRDYDRSAEGVNINFSARNSRNFRYSKAFADVPDAFMVSYADADLGYDNEPIYVRREGATGNLIENVTYEGLTSEAEVRRRAKYDFDTDLYRSTFYTLDAPGQAITCEQGDLVGVSHDMLSARFGSARVTGWKLDDAGDVTTIYLDDAVRVENNPYFEEITNVELIEDVSRVGMKTGVVLSRTNGDKTAYQVTSASGMTDVLTLKDPIPSEGIDVGIMAFVGGLNNESRRLVVADIQDIGNQEFRLLMVDEGNELHEAMA